MSEEIPSFSTLRGRNRDKRLAKDTLDQRDNLIVEGRFLDVHDRLRLIVSNGNVGITSVVMIARMMRPNGDVAPIELSINTTGVRAVETGVFNIGVGWLIGILIRPVGVFPLRGQTYTRIDIINSKDNVVPEIVVSGYITQLRAPSYPLPLNESDVSGKGAILSIAGTDPAAGAEISETVPNDAQQKLKSMRFQLVTDATAINRTVAIIIDDGTTELYRYEAPSVQAASLTFTYIVAPVSSGILVTNNVIIIPIPDDFELDEGFRVRTETTNLQAGDNFGAPQELVEEWISVR